MKYIAIGLAALAVSSPVAAADLGCWDTQTISANAGSPEGTYVHSGANVDYIMPLNDGVDTLIADLSAFDTGSFVVCLQGDSTEDDDDEVWQLFAAIICPMDDFMAGACPG